MLLLLIAWYIITHFEKNEDVAVFVIVALEIKTMEISCFAVCFIVVVLMFPPESKSKFKSRIACYIERVTEKQWFLKSLIFREISRRIIIIPSWISGARYPVSNKLNLPFVHAHATRNSRSFISN